MNKKWLWPVLMATVAVPVIAVTGCAAQPSAAQSTGTPGVQVNLSNQQEGVWVNGQGKVSVVPDVAVISLGVEAQAATVGEAQTQAATAMDKIMNVLTTNGVAKKDIKTQYFNINRVTRWEDKGQKEVVIGYRVSNIITARIRDLAKTGTIIDAAAQAAGDLTRVNGISFTVDDPTNYQKQAREKAMADAKAKAEQMAALSGVTLGKPTYISESSYYAPPMPVYRAGAAMDAVPAPMPATVINPGEQDITLTVQVAYAIIK